MSAVPEAGTMASSAFICFGPATSRSEKVRDEGRPPLRSCDLCLRLLLRTIEQQSYFRPEFDRDVAGADYQSGGVRHLGCNKTDPGDPDDVPAIPSRFVAEWETAMGFN